MCEILVRLKDGTCPEVEANPLRGYIVVVKPDGHAWGRCEGPPEYGVVAVPGLDPKAHVERERPWHMAADLSIVTADYVNDAFRMRLSAMAWNARTGEGKITEAGLIKSKADRFLAAWGATGVTFGDNAAEFDIRIADAYRSRQFWNGTDLAGFTLADVSYDQATGVHRVRITYPATLTTKERDEFEALCRELTTFVSINTSTRRVTVDIRRSTVRDRFIEEVKQRVENIILRRRRYRLSEATCQAIEAAGGRLTIEAADLTARILDHLTD
jgi:hypothetical protein